MKRYPAWKHAIVLVLLVLAFIYALPSAYPAAPTVEIRARTGQTLTDPVAAVERVLERADIKVASIATDGTRTIATFADNEAQLQAKAAIDKELSRRAVTALASGTTAPAWLTGMGATPVALGLDLRGGAHFLLETDVEFAIDRFFTTSVDAIKAALRDERIPITAIGNEDRQIEVIVRNPDDASRAIDAIITIEPRLSFEASGSRLIGELGIGQREQLIEQAVGQNIETLRRRVDEIGVAEPVITKQGDSRVAVQLPGLQDTARAKEILGRRAALELRGVIESGGYAGAGREFIPSSGGGRVLVDNFRVITGENIIDANYGSDDTGRPAVHLSLDAAGAARMKAYTREHRGEQMAIVLLESGSSEVISAPRIEAELHARFIIHGGGMSFEDANQLSLLLRSGSLAAPMEVVEERTVGPSLGADNIKSGLGSVAGGFVLVALLIAIYYSVFGTFSVAALIVNLLCLTALLGVLGAALTLPGLAGFALTLGMAIDANVLINERIREELAGGGKPALAIEAGYERAFATILDANITTLIAGLALFALGSGPVRGFAVVLCLGIATSMFSAVVFSRALVDCFYGRRRKKVTGIAIG